MAGSKFFEQQNERSRAKTEIVSKYFEAWSQIVLGPAKRRRQNIGFVDLFAGPGSYDDGSYSTPLEVLEIAARNADLAARFEARFNDKAPENADKLRQLIDRTPAVRQLKFRPIVSNFEVTGDLVPTIKQAGEIPTLFFVDPWGYKGLSLELLRSAIRGWGCDLIFFFNYNRIRAAVLNPMVEPLIDDLFGVHRAKALRERLSDSGADRYGRELIILDEMLEAIREIGGDFVLPFKFRASGSDQTSHYLIFVSKHLRGFDVMKDVMSRYGLSPADGRVQFEYAQSTNIQLGFLEQFFRDQSLVQLESWLADYFAGRSVTVKEIYDEYETQFQGTAFTRSEYKQALIRLESAKRIVFDRPPEKRMQGGRLTAGDSRVVYFESVEERSD